MIATNTLDPAQESARISAIAKAQSSGSQIDMFQKLFLAQLKTQDPLDPVDNKDFLAQLAQFNSLEQLQSLNDKMGKLTDKNSLGDAAGLIGKVVVGHSADDFSEITGLVDSVRMESGNILLNLGTKSMKMQDVIGITIPQFVQPNA